MAAKGCGSECRAPKGVTLICRHPLGHAGRHRDGTWTWDDDDPAIVRAGPVARAVAPPAAPAAFALVAEPPTAALALAPTTPRDPLEPARVYIASLGTNDSRRTATEALQRIARLLQLPSWEAVPWGALRMRETELVRDLLSKHARPTTARLTLSFLKNVLRYAWRLGHMTADEYTLATGWPKIRAMSEPRGRALTKEEAARFWTYTDSLPSVLATLTRAIFVVALGAGLRRAELAGLVMTDLNEERSSLRVFGKGQKEKHQHLPGPVSEALSSWIRVRSTLGLTTQALFVPVASSGRVIDRPFGPRAMWAFVVRTMRAAGVYNIATHDLRRTFASSMLDHTGGDLSRVQTLMRHESAATTARYDKRGQAAADAAADAAFDNMPGWVPGRRRFIQCPVVPLDGVEIDVDLKEILTTSFRGGPPGRQEVDPVFDWIQRGLVRLTVLSFRQLLSQSDLEEQIAVLAPKCSGKWRHQRLCAIASLYLLSKGKEIDLFGGYGCRYSAGNADVVAKDGSMVVECGDISDPRKLRIALGHNETIMIIPYLYGYRPKSNEQWRALSDETFGYLFEPTQAVVDEAEADAIQNGAGRGLLASKAPAPPEPDNTSIDALAIGAQIGEALGANDTSPPKPTRRA